MPCIYSTTARAAFRSLARPPFTSHFRLQSFRPLSARFASVAPALRTKEDTSPFNADAELLTPAQRSRAARQAVNLCLKEPIGGYQDALFIINSLHHSVLKHVPEATQHPNVGLFSGINFNNTPPRLSSHTLVHSLIREYKLEEAAHLAVSMMECGMRVRGKTLNAIMVALQDELPRFVAFRNAESPRNFKTNVTGLSDLAEMANHPSSRLAVQIFTVARKNGQGSTNGLFGTLLAICLINTEIVLASLVFAMTVKEFYHPPASPEGDATKENWNAEKYGPRSLVYLPRYEHLINITTPMSKFFRHLTHLTTASHHFDPESLDANIQALAILANLLDLRQLHIREISTLLSIMYSTPRVDSQVWIVDSSGLPQRVVAYEYFHDVLVRLIESPPSATSHHKRDNRRTFTPPLSPRACNTLLHYSLRHCHSPTLANKVLIHLTQERRLYPDATAYNIILRSGTLMRDNDLATMAVTSMSTPQSRPIKMNPDALSLFNSNSPLDSLRRSQTQEIRRMAALIEEIHSVELWKVSKRRYRKLKQALYTLTTHVMHFCSTGRPYIAKTIVFALLPILGSSPSLLSSEHRAAHFRERRRAITRAVHYNPITFAVLLNALVKARAFSEARALYNFATVVQTHSWFTANPWVLGTEVYTIMLELCAQEYKEAMKSSHPVKQERAVRMAFRQYKRIKMMTYYYKRTVARWGVSYRRPLLDFPKVDARFATALIKMFVLHCQRTKPHVLAPPDGSRVHDGHRQPLISPESVSETFELARQDMITTYVSTGWANALESMARGLLLSGMDVPLALRHFLLNVNGETLVRAQETGLPLKVIPWAYPNEKPTRAWHPWVVPSIRTRGMVSRKMTRTQRRRRSRRS